MRHLSIITAMAMAVLTVSCAKASLETTYAGQEENIDRFISDETEKHPEYEVVRNGGSNRLIMTKGEGEGASSKVTAYYAAYVFERGQYLDNLIATNHLPTVEEAEGWNGMLESMSFEPEVFDLNDKTIVEGLRNGLAGVKKGEVCQIVFSGKYGFGQKPHGLLPGNSALLYHIWVEDVE